VGGQYPHEIVGEVDRPGRLVLRRDLARLRVDLALDLTLDRHGSPEEVEVAQLKACRLTQSQAGERTEGDERIEVIWGLEQRRADLLGTRDLDLPSDFATRGGVIPAVGSSRITLALTAARKAMRT
jgi:hypothetical protein